MGNEPTRAQPQRAPVDFLTNGRPPVPGAPYADPCVELDGVVPEQLNFRTTGPPISRPMRRSTKRAGTPPAAHDLAVGRCLGLPRDSPQHTRGSRQALLLPRETPTTVSSTGSPIWSPRFTSWTTSRCARQPISWASIHLVKFDVTSLMGPPTAATTKTARWLRTK